MSARFLIGDVFDGLATLEDESVDVVITSPPFLALRSYLPADHPDKGKEIGSEATPAEFIDVLLRVTQELRRVLAPHGSIAVELGDTYAGSGGAGGDYGEGGWRDGQQLFDGSGRRGPRILTDYDADYDKAQRGKERGGTGRWGQRFDNTGPGWPLAKSKTLIPQIYEIALAYGFNPLTGAESPAGRWRVRNVVTWARPNPPVGALGDKWRPATSDVVIACTSEKRYWDDLATRKPATMVMGRNVPGNNTKGSDDLSFRFAERTDSNPGGAPLLDYWEIPPTGYAGSHYATFPSSLVKPLVKAMGPQRVCRECGEPSRRIMGDLTLNSYRSSTRPQTIKAVALADEHGLTDEHIAAVRAFGTSDAGKAQQINNGAGKNTDEVKRLAGEAKDVLGGYFREFVMNTNADRTTTGWTDCGHDDYRLGLVLDPFAGSGTTLLVASGHGLDSIGIDLDERNAELALERVGPLLLEVSS